MKYLAVKKLDEHQHYKDRNMVWFKWRVDAMQDYNFSRLSDTNRWIFVGLVGLACKCDNRIPYDLNWIRKQVSTSKMDDFELAIKELLASKMLAVCYQKSIPIRKDKIREDKRREDSSKKEWIEGIGWIAKNLPFKRKNK